MGTVSAIKSVRDKCRGGWLGGIEGVFTVSSQILENYFVLTGSRYSLCPSTEDNNDNKSDSC